jgi:4-coumarate--CoA ligase
VLHVDCKTERSYTYQNIREASIKLGAGLKAQHSWRQGDVLAVFCPNHINYSAVIFGTHWAGGTASLINSTYTAPELQFQLVDSNAKLLFTHKSLLPTVCLAAKRIGLDESKIFLMGDEEDGRSTPFKHFSTICSPVPLEKSIVDPKNDVAFLIYSSGTTGKPKGVMLTHTNIISNTLMTFVAHDGNLSWKGGPNGKGDRVIGILPFFHSYGLQALIFQGIYTGTELVVMPKFDLEEFCSIISYLKVTYVPVVPPIVLALGKSAIVAKYDLSSIRKIATGAAPLTKDVIALVSKRLNTTILQGYGLSETSPVTHQQVRYPTCFSVL